MTFALDPRLAVLAYRPDNFRDLAETPMAGPLWLFLLRADNVIRMETATLLGRAAVEPLAAGLLAEFGPAFAGPGRDRMKQWVGHMVRQVMEALDYRLDRRGLRITRNNLFTSATRYAAQAA